MEKFMYLSVFKQWKVAFKKQGKENGMVALLRMDINLKMASCL